MKTAVGKSLWVTKDGMFGCSALTWVNEHPGSVLLESNIQDPVNHHGFLFTNPGKVIKADAISDVVPAIELVAAAVKRGFYAAGFITYEAGYAFEAALPPVRCPETPLLWFGLYRKPVVLDHRRRRLTKPVPRPRLTGDARNEAEEIPLRRMPVPGCSREEYMRAVEKIQQYISAGDTYQVNLTFPLSFSLGENSSPAEWYNSLRRSQRVPYSAFINTGETVVLSLSPELFFRKDGLRLMLKPMKGTAPRGRTLAEDELQKRWLRESEKNRAENLMIVDLLRNDAGRIAVPGSVKVRSFFDVERYETVFQATTTIQATLRKDVGIPELFRALFPSGSVTGAPKIRTMQIIHELEPKPRGVYTGSIGFFAPDGKAAFSVAIRTAVLDRRTGRAIVGVGSGVVHDSDSAGEYDECLLKARFLAEPLDDFQLIETILWNPSRGWFLLPLHLKRLRESTVYFGFPFDAGKIKRSLEVLRRSLAANKKAARVRLLLSCDGSVEFHKAVVEPVQKGFLAGMAASRTDSRDRFLFHKTTRRELYERESEIAAAKGMFDVVFQNEKGEVTEGARSNLLVRVGKNYFTPPLGSGLLPGTFRSHLFRTKKIPLAEKVLYPDDLASADEILLCNAIRGLVSVRIPELSPS